MGKLTWLLVALLAGIAAIPSYERDDYLPNSRWPDVDDDCTVPVASPGG